MRTNCFFAVYLLYETANHHLSGIEVRDDSVFKRADCLYSRLLAFVHKLGLVAQRDTFSCSIIYGNDARFVKNNLVILENDSVGSTEIHR